MHICRVDTVSLQSTVHERSGRNLKKKWQDIQSAVKKKEAQGRRNLTQTGGKAFEALCVKDLGGESMLIMPLFNSNFTVLKCLPNLQEVFFTVVFIR